MASDVRTTFRNHFLSIYQSAAADYQRRTQSAPGTGLEAGPSPTAIVNAADRVADLLHNEDVTLHVDKATPAAEAAVTEGAMGTAAKCAALGMEYLQAKAFGDEETAKRLYGEITQGTCDPRWADTLVEYTKYFGLDGTRGTIPYVRAAQAGDSVISIKPNARIGLLGDWGTGGQPARDVLTQLKEQQPDIVVHLGDIYYSGTEEECRTNFEDVMNSVLNRQQTKIPVYTLSGNHDMYAGGVGYYALIKRLNDGDKKQRASFFCLRASDNSWQLLAMDTGLHDYSPISVTDVVTFVEADEQAWLKKRIAEFSGKTILLSHHQLFSAYSQIGKKDQNGKLVPYNKRLKTMFDDLRSTGKPIPAWFWGHEHNLTLYGTYLNLKYGRCLGHSAVPVFDEQDPYEQIDPVGPLPEIKEKDKTTLPMVGNVYAHGFAMLTLGADGKAKAEYFNTGAAGQQQPFHSETIE